MKQQGLNECTRANLACLEVFPDVVQVNQPILPFVNRNIRRYKHSEKAYGVTLSIEHEVKETLCNLHAAYNAS